MHQVRNARHLAKRRASCLVCHSARRYDRSMRSCLIIQFEPRHEEVLPSVIAACNAAGYRPTVLLNRRIRRVRGDFFAEVTGGQAEILYQSMEADWDDPDSEWPAVVAPHDFIVMNTMNRTRAAKWAASSGQPVLAFVHNVDQFMDEPAFHDLLDRPDFAFLTLGPHVTSELNDRLEGRFIDRIGHIFPVVLSDETPAYEPGTPRKVVVQGNMSLNTRNYSGLIAALRDNPGRWDSLTFEFPSSGADREQVEAEIAKAGLSERMHLCPLGRFGQVPTADLFASLKSATVLHPLIAPDFSKYQRVKITSTTSISIGLGLPMVMDRWSEACYRFPMLVSDNRLEASLDRLADASDDELTAIHQALGVYRAQSMAHSGREMERLIARVLSP